jgi:type I restriction enzyme S subunit
MAGEWRQTRLGDLVTLRGGLAYDGRLISDCGDALVTMGCVARGERFNAAGLRRYAGNASDLHRLGAGDLVIATRDVTQNRELIGAPAIVPAGLPGRPILATNMYRVINHSEVPTTFLYWLLRSPEYREHIVASAKGTTVVMITKDAVEDFRFRLPPLSEQRAIAHILDTLDDKIELNRRMSQTLEAMARALFKAWFVDFEPVRAKMEGRWERGQSLPGLPAHLYDLFPDRLVDSELGPIPEGWKVGTLADLAVLNPEVWKTETRPAKIIYVDLSNTKWGRIDSLTAYDSADAPSRAQRVLRPGDTIVGTVRPGNGSYAFIAEGGLTGSTGFAVLRPRAAHYAEVVYLAATAPDNIDRLAHLADGAAYPAVRPEVVAATPVVCPGDEVLARFSQAAGPALAKIAQNERASRTLAALRDALLPKLIRGEIRVKDVEQFLKERVL